MSTVEKIQIKKECEMLAIQVETYQKSVTFVFYYRPFKNLAINYFLMK